MGRPLFSTLIEPAVRVSEPVYTEEVVKGGGVACERWSITNPFDPDDDAFFDNEHAVYEAFLSEEEVRAQALATRGAFSLQGTRLVRNSSSSSNLYEMNRRRAETTNTRAPFEDIMGQVRAQQRAQRLLSAAEAPRPGRTAPSRPEDGSTIPRANVRIRARVMNRMMSGDATTVSPSSSHRGTTENSSAPAVTYVDGPLTSYAVSPGTQPGYPIFSAYSEERLRASREEQERELQDARMRVREAQLRAEEALRTRNVTPEERSRLARDIRNPLIEAHNMRQSLAEPGVRRTRHLDDVVERIREGTARSASFIQRYPNSAEAQEARDLLDDAGAMLDETLRRDDEMEQEIRASQDRDQNRDGEVNERLRGIQSRRIAINTDLDSLRPSGALSPSSVAASATSSSGSSRIVAPRMARSPISPPSAMPLHSFALPGMRTRPRPAPRSNAGSLDDMPGLLDVEHSSEDEDSLSSQTDNSSDWSTDYSGRSSPADERASSNPAYFLPLAPEIDFDRHDWSVEGLRASRGTERSSSPPDLIPASRPDTPLSPEASVALDPISLDTAELSLSPSAVYSTMPIPIPTTPSRSHARNASSGTPGVGGVLSMTPPASVTPRFLTWGGRSTSPPGAAPASPSANRRRRTSATLPWLSSQNWNAF